MGNYRVCVYAICKNEAKFARRWMASMSEADDIVVLDTGSTDGTPELLRSLGASVTEEVISPWRFDTARNRSMELIPPDTDICVCTDLDEVFHPGWRELLERAWSPGAGQATYRYTWSFQPDGSEGVVFWYEKAHARWGYQWVHPVHEVLCWTGPGKPGPTVVADGVQLDHHPDPKKSRGQYLPLLELSVAEDPEDDRNVHYLGREYLYYGRWDDCIATLKRHLAMPSADWPGLVSPGGGRGPPPAGTLHRPGPAALSPGGVGWGAVFHRLRPGHHPPPPHLYLRGRPLGQPAPRPAVHRLLRHRPPAPGLRRGPPGPGAGTGQRKTM